MRNKKGIEMIAEKPLEIVLWIIFFIIALIAVNYLVRFFIGR